MRKSLYSSLILVAVSACGGGSAGSAPATEEGLQQTAKEMAEVTFDNPVGMYDYLSAQCRSEISRGDFAGQAMFAKVFLDAIVDGRTVTIATVNTRNVTATSGEAEVIVELDGEVFESEPGYDTYVYEDGAWKSTDCPEADLFGDDSDDESDAPSDTVGGELRSADEVRAEEAVQGTRGEFGSTVELDGVTVTLSSPTVLESDEPTLRTDIRVENRLTEQLWYVPTEIICAGSPAAGTWGWESTFSPGDEIPSGSYADGYVDLKLPNPDYNDEPPPCDSPAHIVVRPVPDSWDDIGQAVWQIPDDLLMRLNN